MKNPYQKAYQNNRVLNASPAQLIIMLYEGALRFNEQAISYMHYSTYDKVNHYITRAIDIIVELKTSLNLEAGGEVAQNLDALYDYMLTRLRHANQTKDKSVIEEVNRHLGELLSAWKEIDHLDLSASTATPSHPAMSPPPSLDGLSLKG